MLCKQARVKYKVQKRRKIFFMQESNESVLFKQKRFFLKCTTGGFSHFTSNEPVGLSGRRIKACRKKYLPSLARCFFFWGGGGGGSSVGRARDSW